MNVLRSQSLAQVVDDENSNSFLTNSSGIKLNQSDAGIKKQEIRSPSAQLASTQLPAFVFSDMESVSFSSSTDDDDTTEIEQHYEEKIKQLQSDGLQLHQFYVKKCDANKQLSLQNRDLQKQLADLRQKLHAQSCNSLHLSPGSTSSTPNGVSSPLSAIKFIKSQVKQIYHGPEHKCRKIEENKVKLRKKFESLKNELHDESESIGSTSIDDAQKSDAFQDKIKALSTTVMNVQQSRDKLVDQNRELKLECSSLKDEIKDLVSCHETTAKEEAASFKQREESFEGTIKAKDSKISELRSEIESLRSDLKSYEKKLQKSTKTMQVMRKKSDQEILKERNSRNRLVALGEKELERLRNEIAEKDLIIEKLRLNINKHTQENQCGKGSTTSTSSDLQEKNGQLEKELNQAKSKMNLLYSLLEKERRRRANAEKNSEQKEINKSQILKALHISKRQSSQDIQIFKASLTSTLNNALQKVNSIIVAEGSRNKGEAENRQLQVKIDTSFNSLREQL